MIQDEEGRRKGAVHKELAMPHQGFPQPFNLSPELPVATVFARTPSLDQLLLVCHVTGFYPRPISVAWLQDGCEVPPSPVLNTSTILPNADLTYQLRSILAVAPRDGHSYVCRVQQWTPMHPQSLSLLSPQGKSMKALSINITIMVLHHCTWCYTCR
uniref:Ig-like domain-containing protein n=1 Tax=Malurus cyaneus samueli TaxID=2593467 RepID=A0A8C5U738_9PASS